MRWFLLLLGLLVAVVATQAAPAENDNTAVEQTENQSQLAESVVFRIKRDAEAKKKKK